MQKNTLFSRPLATPSDPSRPRYIFRSDSSFLREFSIKKSVASLYNVCVCNKLAPSKMTRYCKKTWDVLQSRDQRQSLNHFLSFSSTLLNHLARFFN